MKKSFYLNKETDAEKIKELDSIMLGLPDSLIDIEGKPPYFEVNFGSDGIVYIKTIEGKKVRQNSIKSPEISIHYSGLSFAQFEYKGKLFCLWF